MTENKVNDWLRDIEALQRQYVAAWSNSGQQAHGASAPNRDASASASSQFASNPFSTLPPWQDGLEQLRRWLATVAPNLDTAGPMMSNANNYLAMLHSIFGSVGRDGAVPFSMPMGASPLGWPPAMYGFSAFTPSADSRLPGIDALYGAAFSKAVENLMGNGAHGFGQTPTAFEQMHSEATSWLRMPMFGADREKHEEQQKAARALVEFQTALQNYNQLMMRVAQAGFARFQKKFEEPATAGQSIESIRALYDVWVDAMEEAYAETALSDEFAKVYGELGNAQMRVRGALQKQVERVCADFNIPTRSELDGVHKKLQALRRELRDALSDRSEGTASPVELHSSDSEVRPAEAETVASRRVVSAKKTRKKTKQARVAAAAASIRNDRVSGIAQRNAVEPEPDREARPAEILARTSRKKMRPQQPRNDVSLSAERSTAAAAPATSAAPATFGDAIVAMRRRVDRKSSAHSQRKVAAATMSKSNKLHKPGRKGKESAKRDR